MSQDQQKPPESVSSAPQTSPTPSVVAQSGTGYNRSQTAELSRNRQPFFKALGIKTLRGTIGLLEGVVERLETEPVSKISPTTPPTPSVSTPVLDSTTATPEPESASSVSESALTVPVADRSTSTPHPTAKDLADGRFPKTTQPKLTESTTTKPQLTTDRVLPSFGKFQAFWNATLKRVRSLLPAAWNEKLSDWALTSAIAGTVVLLLVTTASLLPKTPDQLAKAPPNSIEAPPELKAPEAPKPVEVAPPPKPELTPEQSLVAAVQNQVAEITNQYGKGLIKSVEANFLTSRLVVKVGEGWYELKESEQNKLADEILGRSQQLDFSKLEITDLQGTLLARSPVVGSNMVILKRQELAVNLSS